MDIFELLTLTVNRKASDLHLSSGITPMIRVDGVLQPVPDTKPLSATETQKFIEQVMTEGQKKSFKEQLEIDFAYATQNQKNRFRVNAFTQQRGPSAAFRPVPSEAPTLQELGLPPIVKEFCHLNNGIILVTGPTGSGKSTTLAAMINYINENMSDHIITIEDPVEFTHTCKKCLINQREINKDTLSFQAALRSALREDPDIILVGELRDLETIRLALTAAETGHLVFATLHTNSAAKSIDRVIDVFPAGEKDMVRSMFSESLRGIVAQTLLPRISGGRVAALEILVSTPAIRNLIRENKVPQIYSAIQSGQSFGMQTLEQNVQKLLKDKVIASLGQT